METIKLHARYQRIYDFQDVMEIDKEWYGQYLAENPHATPHQIWDAAMEDGYEAEIEWSEPDWNNENIMGCWIGDSND